MKRTILICLAALLILCAFGCILVPTENAEAAANEAAVPAAEGTPAPALEDLKTLGDAFAYELRARSVYEDRFIYACQVQENVFWRVEAVITPELYAQIDALDFFDEAYEQKLTDLVKDLPIDKAIDLSENLMSQQEMDALVGKTGQELLDMGFLSAGSYGFAEDFSWVELSRGAFSYEVFFNERVKEQKEDYDVEETIRDMTVSSFSFSGALSDAASDKELDF